MTEPDRRCPTCGARRVDEIRVNDASTGTAVPVWQCAQQHWWLQSMVHGLIPIDPGAMPGDEATTIVEDASDCA